MNCKTCKYWTEIGETMGKIGDVVIDDKLGSCSSQDAIMNVIRTEEDEENLTISIIVGLGTGLYTRPEFGCIFHELLKDVNN